MFLCFLYFLEGKERLELNQRNKVTTPSISFFLFTLPRPTVRRESSLFESPWLRNKLIGLLMTTMEGPVLSFTSTSRIVYFDLINDILNSLFADPVLRLLVLIIV